ncbi:HTH-type transcriptional regulator GltC [Austwickia sp. TVS 96-490-7B]|uniref:LysR family transcriptional regulator n=1 Tax=Austwickia sp. TVS 96-490-7B TaxID=2830843 RepID=UPI001C58E341|nr:LysR family transcriptional regulator [Austwickia sp. TVS 96-490-7B]MBW3085564.1 HTH-type transcriptional regulator GltC [Austwickia sp. TVS 96-490-7B]
MLADDLTWFLTLADCEHMTDAAALLGIPQSTLSRRLSRLESDLGADLFDRHGRQLTLNSRGRVLRDHYLAARRELDRGETEIRRLLDPETGTVRFGFMHSLGPWLAPRLLRAFLARHPRTDVRLTQGTGTELAAHLDHDDCDVVLCSPRPVDPRCGWQVVRRQPLALAVPDGHHLAGRHRARWSDVAGEPLVTTPPGFTTRALLDALDARAGRRSCPRFESAELATVAGLVSAGFGVAVLPADDPALQVPGLTMVPLVTSLRRVVGLAWTPQATHNPTARAFIDVARDLSWDRP